MSGEDGVAFGVGDVPALGGGGTMVVGERARSASSTVRRVIRPRSRRSRASRRMWGNRTCRVRRRGRAVEGRVSERSEVVGAL